MIKIQFGQHLRASARDNTSGNMLFDLRRFRRLRVWINFFSNFCCYFYFRSILYYVDLGSMSAVVPIDLPVRIVIVDVSICCQC